MAKESGPICHRAVPYTASRLVLGMLALPPLIILGGALLSGGKGERPRSGEAVWHFSPAHMEERARVVRNVILPEAASSRVVVEAVEGYNADGSWRGMWKANVLDRRDVFLFTATWEDTTGELIQLSRSINGPSPAVSPETMLRSSAEAAEGAQTWMGKLNFVSRRPWKVESTGRQGSCWRVYLTCPDGRMLVQMDAKTGRPAYLSFRPSSFSSMRGIE
jgi:hypothetical protein